MDRFFRFFGFRRTAAEKQQQKQPSMAPKSLKSAAGASPKKQSSSASVEQSKRSAPPKVKPSPAKEADRSAAPKRTVSKAGGKTEGAATRTADVEKTSKSAAAGRSRAEPPRTKRDLGETTTTTTSTRTGTMTTRTGGATTDRTETRVRKASGEKSSMRRRFKDAAEMSSRRVRRASNSLSVSAKRFSSYVSRPIKERSLNNFAERVKARKERRLKAAADPAALKASEDAFPRAAPGSVSANNVLRDGPPSEKSDRSFLDSPSDKSSKRDNTNVEKIFPDLSKEKKEAESSKKSTESRRRKRLFGRKKAKDGEAGGGGAEAEPLFVDGKPFWMRGEKISEEEKNEITQDDLPMNADVIIDVKSGKIDLAVLPNQRFKFDPYAPLSTLQDRDAIFFTSKMLFANTIRSMINTTETIQDSTETQTQTDVPEQEKTGGTELEGFGTIKQFAIQPHPTVCTTYDRAAPGTTLAKEPYEWTGKGCE